MIFCLRVSAAAACYQQTQDPAKAACRAADAIATTTPTRATGTERTKPATLATAAPNACGEPTETRIPRTDGAAQENTGVAIKDPIRSAESEQGTTRWYGGFPKSACTAAWLEHEHKHKHE